MRRHLTAILILALLGWLAPAYAQQRSVALVGATLIDGTGAPPVVDSAVLVEGTRIAAAGPAAEVDIPEDAQVIDLSGKWLIPGLIDAHVHLFQSGGLYTRPDVIDLRTIRPYEEEITRIRHDLPETFARYIASGITSVLDLGGPMWTFQARALAESTRIAPRVAVTGPLLSTGIPPELAGVADPPMLRIETPQQARSAVRQLLAHRPDLIKVWFVRPGADLDEDLSWVRAAIEESHAAGIPVVIHATQLRVARVVIEAGADALAHSIEDRQIGPELARRMAEAGVVYVATLMVEEGYREVLGGHVELSGIERRLGDPEAITSWDDLEALRGRGPSLRPSLGPLRRVDPIMAGNLVRLRAARVRIAAGSDAGNIGTLHGPALHRELELLVEAGLTPMQALIAATWGGAEAMGRSHDLGTIEPGKLADMVVLEADPLVDIRNTRRIGRVVKGGEVFDPAAIAASLNAME